MMKKFSFKVAMVAVVATVAGMGIYSSQKADVTSDIALANVEALANGEYDTPYRVHPCPSWTGNECKTSNEDRPKCYSLTYCW